MPRDNKPSKTVTILDVARESGVSKSTVSLVLQGSPLIRDETAQRVREVAGRLGYVYNRRAAELRSQASNVVGVVINDLMNPFFAEVLVGVERRLEGAGYIVLMAHTHEDLERQRKVLASMREQNAAGLIICPAFNTPRTLPKEVQGWGIPMVVLVRSLGTGSYDYVGSDNEAGVLQAVRHLASRGHTRIGFLGGHTGVVYDQRLKGYRKGLEESGVACDPSLIVESDPSRQGGHAAMKQMLAMKPKVTAAVCYNDITAFGALAALGEHGLQAGKDFALVGFDNVLAAAHSNPPLTTVDVQPSQLGEQAAQTLLARLENPALKRQVYLTEPHLIQRQSS